MAVIVTNKEMPKSCKECFMAKYKEDNDMGARIAYILDCKGEIVDSDYLIPGRDSKRRRADCPLASAKVITGISTFKASSEALRFCDATRNAIIEDAIRSIAAQLYQGGYIKIKEEHDPFNQTTTFTGKLETITRTGDEDEAQI